MLHSLIQLLGIFLLLENCLFHPLNQDHNWEVLWQLSCLDVNSIFFLQIYLLYMLGSVGVAGYSCFSIPHLPIPPPLLISTTNSALWVICLMHCGICERWVYLIHTKKLKWFFKSKYLSFHTRKCIWIYKPSLIQVMACHIFGIKALPALMSTYCSLNPYKLQ